MYSATKAHRIRDFRLVGSDGAPFHTSRTTYLPPGRASFSLPATTYLPPSPSAFHIWAHFSSRRQLPRAVLGTHFHLARKAPASKQMLGRPWARAALRLRSAHGSATSRSSWAPAGSGMIHRRPAASWTCVPTTAVNMSTREAGGGRLPTYLPAGSQPLGTDYLPTFTGTSPSLRISDRTSRSGS